MDDFENLYRTEYEGMVRLARLLTGSMPIAEEVVQDAFLAMHSRIDRIDNPGGYLRRTVVNNCHNQARRKGVEQRKLSMAPSAEERPVLPPELDETWAALDTLKPRQRTALVLRYYQDLSVREIAEVMNTREGTVKSLIHRGLRQLKTEVAR